jgi:hypothetical protein
LLEDVSIEKLIVLIDDLDRCLPDVAINTLEAVRLFMFTEKTAFGDDGTVYTETSIYEMQNKNSEGMGIQLRSFQYAIDKIKQDRNRAFFYIHKPGPLSQVDEYLQELADIYARGLFEVDNFIQDNLAEEGSNNDL